MMNTLYVSLQHNKDRISGSFSLGWNRAKKHPILVVPYEVYGRCVSVSQAEGQPAMWEVLFADVEKHLVAESDRIGYGRLSLLKADLIRAFCSHATDLERYIWLTSFLEDESRTLMPDEVRKAWDYGFEKEMLYLISFFTILVFNYRAAQINGVK